MLKLISEFINRSHVPDLPAWKRACQHRAQTVIRDWQMANRVALNKSTAEDLARRIASALTDAVAVGAIAAKGQGEKAATE